MENITRIENTLSVPLDAEGFSAYRGWSENLAEQLVTRSREPEMLRRVPRDALQRFRDVDSAHEWYRKNKRIVYALAHEAILGGVVWFSSAPRAENNASHTFAIRMYESSRERGMAGPFMSAALVDFENLDEGMQNIWLETDNDNLPALKLYKQQGFTPIHQDKDGRVTMIRQLRTEQSE